MFEKASREKFRFATQKGVLTVEDLWDIPLTSRAGLNLDDIARGLYKQLKDTDTESFVIKATVPNATLQAKFDIVKHIIDVRLAEKDKAEQEKLTKEKKQKILAIIAQKDDEALIGKLREELLALANSL